VLSVLLALLALAEGSAGLGDVNLESGGLAFNRDGLWQDKPSGGGAGREN